MIPTAKMESFTIWKYCTFCPMAEWRYWNAYRQDATSQKERCWLKNAKYQKYIVANTRSFYYTTFFNFKITLILPNISSFSLIWIRSVVQIQQIPYFLTFSVIILEMVIMLSITIIEIIVLAIITKKTIL